MAAEETRPGSTVRSAVLALIGLLLIVIPAIANHPLRVIGGGALGAVVAASIIRAAYANRPATATARKGLPAWAKGLGAFGAALGIVAAELGGGAVLLGFVGGFLLTIAVAQEVFRRRTTK